MEAPTEINEILGWLASFTAACHKAIIDKGVRPACLEPGLSVEDMTYLMFTEEELSHNEAEQAAFCAVTGGADGETLSTEALYFLIQRAMCASDFLGQVYPPAAQDGPFLLSPDWNQAMRTAWLLCELWNRRGDHWMKLTCLQLSSGIPLYGILPKDEDSVE